MKIALDHHQINHLAEAEAMYRSILAQVPNHAGSLHLLGVLKGQSGHTNEAIALIRRAITINPNDPEYHSNLGECLRRAGRWEEAFTSFHRAIDLGPNLHMAHGNLGFTLWQRGRCDEAVAELQRAIQLKPDFPEAYNGLGCALSDQGWLDEAIAALERAIQLRSDYAEAYNNLSIVLRQSGRFSHALDAARRAYQLRPEDPEVLNSLGVALHDNGRNDESIATLERAIQRRANYAKAHSNLGVSLLGRGEPEAASSAFRRAVALEPSYAAAHSNLLACEHYRSGVTLAGLARAHVAWDERHASPLRSSWRDWPVVRDPDRPIRVGLISPDFRLHPVGIFLSRVVKNLHPRDLELVCYYSSPQRDVYTERIAAAAPRWRNVVGVGDSQLAEQIRGDRVDILFDLSGHMGGNHLLVFARKPAPIQITWMGYVGTTGLAAMDYLIADRYHIPAEAGAYYTERILRMPDGYLCFEPPAESPSVGPLPALANRKITFGSFNNACKLTPDVIRLWSEILHRLPRSRLLLIAHALDGASARERIRAAFQVAGVGPDRVELRGSRPLADLLTVYNEVDVALDTFPYSGCTTTCEALWMGVPVITLPGETFASRHSLSHLSNVGLKENIATDARQYVELAVQLAEDLPSLSRLRANLRDRMACSPLCDGERFARHLTDLLRGVWQEWCRG